MSTAQLSTKTTEILTIEDLLSAAEINNPGADLKLIREAYDFAEAAHHGQLRKTGEPYIQHPLHVAHTIAHLRLGTSAIIASLLHDVREDTAPEYYDQISKRFGDAVNFLVEGVTKLTKIHKLRENRGSIEDLRNIFFAMSRDIRVIIIKLADRVHNLETLYGLESERQKRIAHQTLDIYAPIADRLGIGEIKGQLEDLAFGYAMPEKAKWVTSLIKEAHEERTAQCKRLMQEVSAKLKENNIPVLDIHGRAKRLYSLYLKLVRYNNDISQIYDLVALRVIVPSVDECYKALGIIHSNWKPLVGKIKDYVATPKANGYQSLHTTVIVDEGKYLEIQIRTQAMHERAEHGIAAAWAYADSKRKGRAAVAQEIASAHDIAWVEQLAKWQQEVENPEEFFQTLRSDFFKNRIFCMTPAGEVINLPEGATPIDFAYAVHTELGHTAAGAKINQQPKPLDHQLQSGDLVEIQTTTERHGPRREWLDFIKTTTARKAIKQWYNTLDQRESLEVGTKLFSAELRQLVNRTMDSLTTEQLQEYLQQYKYRDLNALLIAIGKGDRNPHQVVKRIFAEELYGVGQKFEPGQLNVLLEGLPGLSAKRAKCCRPIEGDIIVAAVVGEHAVIHRDECPTLQHFKGIRRNAMWRLDAKRHFRIWIHVTSKTYVGMLRDVTSVCAQRNVPILDVRVTKLPSGASVINLLIEIDDVDRLSDLFRKLKGLTSVLEARRGRVETTKQPAAHV